MIYYYDLKDEPTKRLLNELFPRHMKEIWEHKNGYSITVVGSSIQVLLKAGRHLTSFPLTLGEAHELMTHLLSAAKTAAANEREDEQC